MIDILLEVRTILYANADLITLLGGKHVYINKTSNPKQFPRVILYQMPSGDTDYADDNPTAIDYSIQVSIFDKKETLTLFNAVDPILKANGWRQTFNHETYEEDEQVFHRPLRYRQKIQNL